MSILPSPPLPDQAHSRYYTHPQPDSTMKALVTSSWRVVEQPPPPTLREILEAYKARGDGDREMLLAMLNAKSSEDQRIASIATLHRTMLDMYQVPRGPAVPPIPPLHLPDAHHTQTYSHPHHFPSPPASYHHSPHPPASQSLHYDHSRSHQRTDSSSSTSHVDHIRDRSSYGSSSQQTRKRRRTSRSPPAAHSRARVSPSHEAMSAHSHSHELPPSPYSPASSAHSSGGSPRSRESMAINSLLLNSRSISGDDETPKRNTSSERSTTTASRER
ncbi:hypothetical protein C8Q74DRAFT_170230 [Fomes fomentarius]|nr:hypothetical protein C8Q74DRAFT_170230 [Fomes fomentarius]